MNLVQRVSDILLKPQATWTAIAAEDSTPASLTTGYVLPLAAIAPVATLIGSTVFGMNLGGVTMRVPIVSAVVTAVLSFAMAIALMFVMARVVDMLAPNFGSKANPNQAFKLMAYSATAGMVGGIVGIVPALGVLGLIAALYSIYLLYLGLPALMQCPADKQVAFTAVIVVCMLVVSLVMGLVIGLVTPSPMPQLH